MTYRVFVHGYGYIIGWAGRLPRFGSLRKALAYPEADARRIAAQWNGKIERI